MAEKHKVLIVGGGFSGVKAALGLVDDKRFDVTLLSNSDALRYYPTLYHTATGGQYANSSIPLERIFEGKKITIVCGTAKKLDRKFRVVGTEEGTTLPYDSLVLGMGVVTNYFGIPGMEEFAYSIKSQDAVQRFKQHLHDQITKTGKLDKHYIVVGGGPTGVELAGALPGYLKELAKNHGIPVAKPHIDLVESSPRVLVRMPPKVSRAVQRRLKRLGVTLYLASKVEATSASDITVNGKSISSHTVIWTAGVTNHPFFAENEFVLMNRGKVAVDAYLQTEENIYVTGDNANTPFSGLAQTAVVDGAFVATNIRRKLSGRPLRSYRVVLPTSVIPCGKRWAVMQHNDIILSGKLGWLLREAGDFIGFRDLERLDRAVQQFLTGIGREEDCEICAAAQK